MLKPVCMLDESSRSESAGAGTALSGSSSGGRRALISGEMVYAPIDRDAGDEMGERRGEALETSGAVSFPIGAACVAVGSLHAHRLRSSPSLRDPAHTQSLPRSFVGLVVGRRVLCVQPTSFDPVWDRPSSGPRNNG
eukprot:1464609-Prymnesium_polylepis.1